MEFEFERTYTVRNTNAQANVVALMGLSLPGGNPKLEISAWQSATSALPALLLENTVSLDEAENPPDGVISCILAIPTNGSTAKARFSNDIRTLTLYFPQAVPGQGLQYVTVKIRTVK